MTKPGGSRDVDVVVVGAGPTGLTLAHELARFGVSCRVLEREQAYRSGDTASLQYRAIGAHRRSLEILGVMGVIDLPPSTLPQASEDQSAGAGTSAYIYTNGVAPRVRWPAATRYGGTWIRQAEIQRRLLEALSTMGVDVEFGREVTSVRQTSDGVVAIAGDEEIRGAWLVGADGGRSTVRKQLGLAFGGVSHPFDLVIADVEVSSGDVSLPWDAGAALLWLRASRPLWIGPLPGHPGGRRMVAPVRADDEGADAVTPSAERVQAILTERSGDRSVRIDRLIWAASWRMSERMVDHYRVGRVLLAGDAAHVHSPVGGQGMNTGIQDAYNLAWKLAMVVSRRASEDLVDTYEAERLPIAAGVLRLTRQLHRTAIGATALRRQVRDRVLVPSLRLHAVRDVFQRRMSQVSWSYRRSSLSHSEGAFSRRAPRAGDRAPDAACLRYPGLERTSLLAESQGTCWQLLLLLGENGGGQDLAALDRVADAVTRRYGDRIATRLIVGDATASASGARDATVLIDDGAAVRAAYDARKSALYLIRPDGYVALRCEPPSSEAIDRYLAARELTLQRS